jgi:hypothetical protein
VLDRGELRKGYHLIAGGFILDKTVHGEMVYQADRLVSSVFHLSRFLSLFSISQAMAVSGIMATKK